VAFLNGRTTVPAALAVAGAELRVLASTSPSGAAPDPGRDAEELALIRRCVAGDAEAFRPLVTRYQRIVFSVAFRLLGNRADADDVAQQAFVDAFDALDRFDDGGRAHAFSTWVLRIAVNRSKDVLKSKKRTEAPLDRDVQASEAAFAHVSGTPEANLAGAQRRRGLEIALMRLPPKYREAVILKDVEELSYEEMKAILRAPITALKIRVVRARTMMRGFLDEDREGAGIRARGPADRGEP
jgi:RNA polymerase sigma-70 factor (ECF subfamily)